MKRQYSVREAAQVLNVAEDTVVEWIQEYRLRASEHSDHSYTVSHEDFTSFLEQNRIPREILNKENISKKRVLIVDDEPDLLDILEEQICTKDGYTAEGVSTAFEAGIFLRRYRPHVVVLDISLTDIDGRKVCRIFKADDEVSHTKIIGISGKISPIEERQILSQGFDAYLRKPFDMDELTKTIEEVL